MTVGEKLQLATALATMLLVFVTILLAIATKQSARIAAREYTLRRRPLVTVTWVDPPVAGDGLMLLASVQEVAGFATTLHSLEASARPIYDLSAPAVQKSEHSTVLSGDVATQVIVLNLTVPQWLRDGRPDPSSPAQTIRYSQAGRASALVADLVITVVISAADEEATREEWRFQGFLHYDRTQQRYVLPAKMHSARLGERAPGRRSRIVDPMLRAWERWWDSVC